MSWLLGVLLLCSSHLVLGVTGCEDGVFCSDKDSGGDVSPTTAQDYTYHVTQLMEGSSAVDMVVLVSLAEGEQDHVLWLQAAIPFLDARLKHLGVGADPNSPNRFALLQFGNESALNTQFLPVNGEIFLPSGSFAFARRQLVRAGHASDGYQAIQYALEQAPFRSDVGVARLVLLVSNCGRSPLPSHTNLTAGNISGLLLESGVHFSSVLSVNMSVVSSESGSLPASPVFGLTGHGVGVVIGDNFTLDVVDGSPVVVSSKEGIVQDYVNLTLDVGGAVWSLDLLSQINVSVIESFIGGVVSQFGLGPFQMEQVCKQCWCAGEGEGEEEGVELVEECGEAEKVCEMATDQKLCSCLAQNTAEECAHLINPSPVSVQIRSTSTLSGPHQTPFVLEVSGSVSQQPGGDVEVAFYSNRNRASYSCILLDNSTLTPDVVSCTSPFQMKGVEEGQHSLLVIAKRKGFYGTRLFDFEVQPVYPDEQQGQQLQLSLSQRWQLEDGFLVLDIHVTGGGQAGGEGHRLFCSISGGELAPCSTPYRVHQDSIEEAGALLVVVAVESRDVVAVATKQLEKPVVESSGPVKIIILGVEPPDALGRIFIYFRTSRSDVDCLCRTNISHTSCSTLFKADPQQLGSGTHNLSIVCMDYDGYSATKNLKVVLPRPPPLIEGPLSCNLSLVGPTPQGVVLAVFGCDRHVMATCQVSGRPAVSCNVPVGIHEINVAELNSGQHLFILTVEDGYGKSLMKIHQFTIGTAHRKCCPQINSAQSSLTMTGSQPPNVFLDLRVLAGNCTDSEGFSYHINWGDGTSEMGLTHRLSHVAVSKVYNGTTTLQSTPVEVQYCNSPVLQSNKCCDHASLLHN